MITNRLLRRDSRGIGAVEFALVAPVLISFVIGVSQIGKLFYANADMKNAMAAGARVASIWPVPKDPEILAAVDARLARTGAAAASDVELTRGKDANGNDYVDIEMSYEVPLDFVFFDAGPVTLSDTRRVFTQMAGVMPSSSSSTSSTTSSAGTTSTTSTTSSGTPSTTSTTSSAGTTTSTTSSGTTSTSATSAGGTTSTSASTSASSSTTSSTTSSSGNGNSNGNSNHDHGNCNKKCT